MQSVKIKRKDLLEVVKKNRGAHRDIFLRAQEGFKKAAIAAIESMLSDAREGKEVRRYIGLEPPTDQTKDYDRLVTMLEMSVDDEITLGQQEFACYVMDDWSWKAQFTQSTSRYL
jgi:hypothetical protein